MKNGVINVYKEKGMTSFSAVYKIKKLTGEKKVGHTGTLDPDAFGVLPICIGKATKLVDLLMDTDKQYRAVMFLGKRTTTLDISGEVLEEASLEEIKEKVLASEPGKDFESNIKKAFESFTGEVEQIPPMYSAIKVNGVKLVDAARKGKEIDRKSRKVNIYSFEDIKVFEDFIHISFVVNCSKGTYVRTLCEDIGKYFLLPACLESLERTKASMLDKESALKLSDIENLYNEGKLEDYIIDTDRFLDKYPKAFISSKTVKKIIFGNQVDLSEVDFDKESENNIYRIYDNDGKFYALYRLDAKDNLFKCEKMFV